MYICDTYILYIYIYYIYIYLYPLKKKMFSRYHRNDFMKI